MVDILIWALLLYLIIKGIEIIVDNIIYFTVIAVITIIILGEKGIL
jgi:hypothetical protein